MAGPSYVPGDFWRICDVCGFQVRSSQTQKRWDGLMVCLADYETRHPQDYVRGRKDRQRVPDPRPETADVFIGDSSDVIFTIDGEQVFSSDGEMAVVRNV